MTETHEHLQTIEQETFALARSFDSGSMRIVQSGFEKKDLLAA